VSVAETERCPTCGRPLDDHNRHVKYGRPDPVLALPAEKLEGAVWGDDPLLAVKDVGCFIRTLLPVRLTGGFTVTYGVWLGVEASVLEKAWTIWHAPEYAQLSFEGLVANALPPWGEATMGKLVQAAVRDVDAIPYVTASSDPLMRRLLGDEWSHDEVLATLPP
jgi:hypothetical protein